MPYLLLSIIFSTSLVLLFKAFEKFKSDNFQVITANYYFASTAGFLIYGRNFSFLSIPSQPWFSNAVIIGVVFFALFVIIAITTRKIGISVASVANKMSLVIPAVAAVFLYGDTMNLVKVFGILLAIFAVYLTSKKGSSSLSGKNYFILPVLIFIGSGMVDTFFKYTERTCLNEGNFLLFIPALFCIAAITGTVVLIIRTFYTGSFMSIKSLAAGFVLGIPNFFSVYFLIRALKIESLQSSVIFPINNIGIVALSAVSAWLVFREKISPVNWAGILLAAIAVLMIAKA